jgi:hypothetical protein
MDAIRSINDLGQIVGTYVGKTLLLTASFIVAAVTAPSVIHRAPLSIGINDAGHQRLVAATPISSARSRRGHARGTVGSSAITDFVSLLRD